MANPKASTTTQTYRTSIKNAGGGTTSYGTRVVTPGQTPVQINNRSSGGSGGTGNPVELFIVGALFIWLVVSGKLKAIIIAGKS